MKKVFGKNFFFFYAVVVLIFLIAFTFIALSVKPQKSDAAVFSNWLDEGWQFRRTISLGVGDSGVVLADHQVRIVLNSDNFDFLKAKSDGSDIRFTEEDGTTVLPYWREIYDSSKPEAVFWVKVADIADGQKIYVYYGNSNAVSVSDGKGTFTFFDDFEQTPWTELSPMPVKRADLAATVIDRKIYLIGGYDQTAGDPHSELYEFDTTTGVYTQKASMPTARWGPIGIGYSGSIYVFGGDINSGTGTNKVEVYSPATNSWTTKNPLPADFAHQGITGCTNGQKIYLFYEGKNYEYNPLTDVYISKSNMPSPIRSWATCAYSNGKIYLIGGWYFGAKNYVQIYDIASNSWSTGSPIPFAFYGAIRENPVVDNNIYIVEGQREDGEFSSKTYVYDIVNNTWSERSFGPYAADGIAGGVVDGKLYAFGGRQDTTGPYGIGFAAVYDPVLDTNSQWTQVTGNFELRNGTLRRMVPERGILPNLVIQAHSNIAMPEKHVVEVSLVSEQNQAWGTVGIGANNGKYGQSLNAYLAPYIDFGAVPQQSNTYIETGSAFAKTATNTTMPNGSVRFSISKSDSSVTVKKDGLPYLSGPINGQYGGILHLIEAIPHIFSIKHVFVHSFSSIEPLISVGAEEIFSLPTLVPTLTPTVEPSPTSTPTPTPTKTPTPTPTKTPTPTPTKTPTPTPTAIPRGDGLMGNYFDEKNLTVQKLTRIDPYINFIWGTSSPQEGVLNANTFSVRWTGKVMPTSDGSYTFYTRTDDGVKLWVNGVLLVNKWINQSYTEWSGGINLKAGVKYDIMMEYFENTGKASAQLMWSGPNVAKQIIPRSSLFSR